MNYFIDNKYTKWYFAIVNHAKAHNISGKFEKHHIVPKCITNDNSNENLVKLTFRQHFVCHLLLVKMTTGNVKRKMMSAIYYMTNKNRNHCGTRSKSYFSSRLFESLKKSRLEIGISDETRHKMSLSMIGKNVGKTASPEAREKMSIAAKQRTVPDEQRQSIAEAMKKQWASGKRDDINKKVADIRRANGWKGSMYGKSHSEETKAKMSAAAKTRQQAAEIIGSR